MNSGPCSFQLRSMFCGRMHPLFQPVFPRFPFSVAAFSFPSKVSVFFTPSVQPPVILSPVSCRGRSTLVLILPWHSSLGLVALSGSPMMLETGENLCAFSCSVTAFQQPPLRRNFIYLSFPFIILGSRNTVSETSCLEHKELAKQSSSTSWCSMGSSTEVRYGTLGIRPLFGMGMREHCVGFLPNKWGDIDYEVCRKCFFTTFKSTRVYL